MIMIRIASVGPLFRSGGFELSRSWSEIDLDSLTAEQLETLHKRVGRWIKVYPGDVPSKDLEAFVEHVGELADKAKAAAKPAAKPTTTTPTTTTETKAAKTARKDG